MNRNSKLHNSRFDGVDLRAVDAMNFNIWWRKVFNERLSIFSHFPSNGVAKVVEKLFKLGGGVISCSRLDKNLVRFPECWEWQQKCKRRHRNLTFSHDTSAECKCTEIISDCKDFHCFSRSTVSSSDCHHPCDVFCLPGFILLVKENRQHWCAHTVSDESDCFVVVFIVSFLNKCL